MVFGVALVMALFMIFVGWRAQKLVANPPDPYGYVAMARSLMRGDGFAAYGSVLNRRGPLYPVFIAIVYSLTGEHPLVLQIVQALMFGATCALVFDIGRRLYNPRTGFIAGIVCAFHPALLRYVADSHIETFLTFLATISLWRSILFLEKPSIRNGAIFGVCAALGALAKPVLLLHPAAFAAWWFFLDRRTGLRRPPRPVGSVAPELPWKVRGIAAAAILVAMGCVIFPWTYRNYRSSGHPVLITTGFGDAFLRGYIFSETDYLLLRRSPYIYAENASNASFEALCRDAGTVWQRDDVESDRILTRASKEKFFADPLAFVRKFVAQLFTFWYEMTSLANSLITGLSALILWILALIGWRRANREGYLVWPLILPIMCLNISLAILLALGRYSVPVLPALAILGAFGVDTLLQRYQGGVPIDPARADS
jgi:4-amino-4-deoxy-L-arabinose transferase-like glycosyltransferase